GVDVHDLAIEWRLGVAARGLDLAARRVELADGSAVVFDGLVIATGARVRTLPGQPNLAGIHTLRTLDDCLALRADLDATPSRVVAVAPGFVGGAVAANTRL